MYIVPNGDVLDVSLRPSVWADIQSWWDGWPVSLCPEWSREMIFLTLTGCMSSSHLKCWPWIKPGLPLDVIKTRGLTIQTSDVYNYTVNYKDKQQIQCHVWGVFLLVKISHVGFQLAVCAADGCCLLDCLCVTSHVSIWGGGGIC